MRDPGLGDDNILVRVEAISVEGGDTLHPACTEVTRAPHVVGYQCAVTVGIDGSHAELRAAPERRCSTIPAGLSAAQAAHSLLEG